MAINKVLCGITIFLLSLNLWSVDKVEVKWKQRLLESNREEGSNRILKLQKIVSAFTQHIRQLCLDEEKLTKLDVPQLREIIDRADDVQNLIKTGDRLVDIIIKKQKKLQALLASFHQELESIEPQIKRIKELYYAQFYRNEINKFRAKYGSLDTCIKNYINAVRKSDNFPRQGPFATAEKALEYAQKAEELLVIAQGEIRKFNDLGKLETVKELGEDITRWAEGKKSEIANLEKKGFEISLSNADKDFLIGMTRDYLMRKREEVDESLKRIKDRIEKLKGPSQAKQ